MATFSGTVSSDFMKLISVEDIKKTGLIDYAATDFLSLRSSLVDYIKAVFPLDYDRFIESDQGMMLAEMMAYVGAVASLKSDLLANENYLRTARKRSSIKKLLSLIGVRLRGPIAAAANAKITWDPAPTWTKLTDELDISVSQRVKNITSADDSGPVSYSLYKVLSDGNVDIANSTGNMTLLGSEAEGDASAVFTNLVLLEGALVSEEGVFTSVDAAKVISLQEGPVIEGSVSLMVSGASDTSGVYTSVENLFFASGASHKIFQIVYDVDYNATVLFGDNTFGQAPGVGDRYIVTYRVGGGTRGNIPNEYLNAPVDGTLNSAAVKGTVENVSLATGGSDAETLDHAKKYAPLTFRRQDRLVTLQDIESFANSYITSYGSIGKATAATRRAYSSANIIDIYVLEKANDTQLRRATPTFKTTLLTAMNEKKMLTDEFVIVDGLIRTLDIEVTVRVDKENKQKEELVKLQVRDKVLDYFRVDNRLFGQAFLHQDLNREVFNLPLVRYSTIDNITSEKISVDFNEIIQLNNLKINVIYV